MSVHTFHPDIHEHGLADGCPRCEEIARDPVWLLDDMALRLLIERDAAGLSGRSRNEWGAICRIRNAMHSARALVKLGAKL